MSRKRGIGTVERFAEGGIQRVDRTVPFGHFVTDFVADSQLDCRFGQHFGTRVGTHLDMVLEPLEMRLKRPRTSFDQQIERRASRLELVAIVLHRHDLSQDLLHQLAIVLDVVLRGQRHDVRSAGQLADQNPPLVADRFGINVLVAGCGASHGVDVHAAFVGKGAGTHERLLVAEVHVRDLVDES